MTTAEAAAAARGSSASAATAAERRARERKPSVVEQLRTLQQKWEKTETPDIAAFYSRVASLERFLEGGVSLTSSSSSSTSSSSASSSSSSGSSSSAAASAQDQADARLRGRRLTDAQKERVVVFASGDIERTSAQLEAMHRLAPLLDAPPLADLPSVVARTKTAETLLRQRRALAIEQHEQVEALLESYNRTIALLSEKVLLWHRQLEKWEQQAV